MRNYLSQQKQKQKNKDNLENVEIAAYALSIISFLASVFNLSLISFDSSLFSFSTFILSLVSTVIFSFIAFYLNNKNN